MKCILPNMSCAKKNLCCHYCDEQKKCTSRCKDNLKSCVYFADEPIVNDDPMLFTYKLQGQKYVKILQPLSEAVAQLQKRRQQLA